MTGSPSRFRQTKLFTGIAICSSGCAYLVLLIIILAAIAFKNGSKTIEQADVVARKFLEFVAIRQTEQAYHLT